MYVMFAYCTACGSSILKSKDEVFENVSEEKAILLYENISDYVCQWYCYNFTDFDRFCENDMHKRIFQHNIDGQ